VGVGVVVVFLDFFQIHHPILHILLSMRPIERRDMTTPRSYSNFFFFLSLFLFLSPFPFPFLSRSPLAVSPSNDVDVAHRLLLQSHALGRSCSRRYERVNCDELYVCDDISRVVFTVNLRIIYTQKRIKNSREMNGLKP
jgi:hypothetical protein